MKQLDLHGIKHSEVKKILDQFLWENIKKNQKEVSIITGISDQMKRVVKECVDDYNMTYTEDFLNPGKIIVKLV